jgi:hypothetical protein
MEFFIAEPVEPPRPKVGDMIRIVCADQERHVIATDVRANADGSVDVTVLPDPTEPPLSEVWP